MEQGGDSRKPCAKLRYRYLFVDLRVAAVERQLRQPAAVCISRCFFRHRYWEKNEQRADRFGFGATLKSARNPPRSTGGLHGRTLFIAAGTPARQGTYPNCSSNSPAPEQKITRTIS